MVFFLSVGMVLFWVWFFLRLVVVVVVVVVQKWPICYLISINLSLVTPKLTPNTDYFKLSSTEGLHDIDFENCDIDPQYFRDDSKLDKVWKSDYELIGECGEAVEVSDLYGIIGYFKPLIFVKSR